MTQSWLWGSQIAVKKKKKKKQGNFLMMRMLTTNITRQSRTCQGCLRLWMQPRQDPFFFSFHFFFFFLFFFFYCGWTAWVVFECVSKRWLLWVLQQQRSRQSNIFLQKLCTKCGGETDPLLKIQNWACLWISSLKVYTICLYSMSRLRATKISKFRCRSLILISNETILNKIQKRFRATSTDKIFGT